jgi:hypothetical protein
MVKISNALKSEIEKIAYSIYTRGEQAEPGGLFIPRSMKVETEKGRKGRQLSNIASAVGAVGGGIIGARFGHKSDAAIEGAAAGALAGTIPGLVAKSISHKRERSRQMDILKHKDAVDKMREAWTKGKKEYTLGE